MIRTLILGWFLTLFKFDELIVSVINQLWDVQLETSAVYWMIVLCIGTVVYIIDAIKD